MYESLHVYIIEFPPVSQNRLPVPAINNITDCKHKYLKYLKLSLWDKSYFFQKNKVCIKTCHVSKSSLYQIMCTCHQPKEMLDINWPFFFFFFNLSKICLLWQYSKNFGATVQIIADHCNQFNNYYFPCQLM